MPGCVGTVARDPLVAAQVLPKGRARAAGVRSGRAAAASARLQYCYLRFEAEASYISVAIHLLLDLATLLRFERKRRRRAGEQSRNTDRIACFLAVTVFAAFDPAERLLHFFQQLALAIARAQLESVFLLDRRAVRRIGNDDRLAQVLGRFIGVLQQFPFHLLQAVLEKRELPLVHVIRL